MHNNTILYVLLLPLYKWTVSVVWWETWFYLIKSKSWQKRKIWMIEWSKFTSSDVDQHLICGLCVCHHLSEDQFSNWALLPSETQQFIMLYNAWLVFLSLTFLIRLMTYLFFKVLIGKCDTQLSGVVPHQNSALVMTLEGFGDTME